MSPRRSRLPAFLVVLALAGFAYAVHLLLSARMTRGDIYPAYSTLRADPLGLKLLHDSLDDVPDVDVVRHFESINRIEGEGPVTLFLVGRPWWFLRYAHRQTFESMNHIARRGGRVVIAFRADDSMPDYSKEETDDNSTASTNAVPEKREVLHEREENDIIAQYTSISNVWQVDFGLAGFQKAEDGGDEDDETVEAVEANDKAIASDGRGPELTWRTTLHFKPHHEAWRVLYRRDRYPVIVERPIGRGSIVLCSDAYFLSNEALVRERAPGLIAHLVGPHRRIVFDEAGLGVRDEKGIMDLVQAYRLQGAVAVLIVLMLLFIWRQGVSFVPPVPDDDVPLDLVAGREAGEGFVHLLRRNISPGRLLDVCFAEWSRHPTVSGKKRARMTAMLQGGGPDPARKPVEAYRALVRIVKEKDW